MRNEAGIAAALAAGGARGAYQAGALLLLAERGMRFHAIAGTSVGALNAAFYAAGDGSPAHVARLIEFWRRLPAVDPITLSPKGVVDKLEMLFSAVTADWFGVATNLARWSPILDPEPLARVLDEALDYEQICRSAIRLDVAVIAEFHPLLDIVIGSTRRVAYIDAASVSPSVLRRLLLAAAAIPALFPSVEVDGRKMSDAGLADALPAQVLAMHGEKRIVSLFLSDRTIQDRADFPGVALFQIRPSSNIGRGLATMLDFSRDSIERLLDLGYRDAKEQHDALLAVFETIETRNSTRARAEESARLLPRRG